jgi:hypothetical protein
MKTPAVNLTEMSSKPSKHVDRAAASIKKPAMQRLNVDIPEDLHAELKSVTGLQKRKIKEVIVELIAGYVQDHLKK